MQQDQDSCLFVTELSEFEQYIMSQYILGLNMIEDLLSKLFGMSRPNSSTDSVKNTTEAINVFKTIKSKTSWG